MRPCDVCGQLLTAARAHTHDHEPGCGISDPLREQCRCDRWLCSRCCLCDIAGLLEVS